MQDNNICLGQDILQMGRELPQSPTLKKESLL